MKKLLLILAVLVLAITLVACDKNTETKSSGDKLENVSGNAVAQEESIEEEKPIENQTSGNTVFTIGDNSFELKVDDHFKNIYSKVNITELQFTGLENQRNMWYQNGDEILFLINEVVFEYKTIDETMEGQTFEYSTKTINGIEYTYFESDTFGKPSHSYIYYFDGDTYVISFASDLDTSNLEEVFMSNVSFKK